MISIVLCLIAIELYIDICDGEETGKTNGGFAVTVAWLGVVHSIH